MSARPLQHFYVYSSTTSNTQKSRLLVSIVPLYDGAHPRKDDYPGYLWCRDAEDFEELRKSFSSERLVMEYLPKEEGEATFFRYARWVDAPEYKEAKRRRRQRQADYAPRQKPKVVVRVRCSAAMHRIALIGKSLVLLNHPADELRACRSVRRLADDTEYSCRCLEIRKAWADYNKSELYADDLPEQLLAMRLDCRPPLFPCRDSNRRREPRPRRQYTLAPHNHQQGSFRKRLREDYVNRVCAARIAADPGAKLGGCEFENVSSVWSNIKYRQDRDGVERRVLTISTEIDHWLRVVWLSGAAQPGPGLVTLRAERVGGRNDLMIATVLDLNSSGNASTKGILRRDSFGAWTYHPALQWL